MPKERKLTKQEERRMQKYPETDTFIWHNENPKGHITNDCVIRAIACGTGLPWALVLEGIHDCEQRLARRNDKQVIETYLEIKGWVKHKQPRHEDGTKYTGEEFCKFLSTNYGDGKLGNVICSVANHMYCIKPTNHGDGINCRYKVLDVWNSTHKTIGNYWTKEKAAH